MSHYRPGVNVLFHRTLSRNKRPLGYEHLLTRLERRRQWTRREKQYGFMIAMGASDAQVSKELGVGVRAVTNALSRMYTKYDIVNRVALAARVLALGLMSVLVADATAPTQYRVNVGGSSYVDTLGNPWSADSGCTSDSTFSRASTIIATLDDTLYQTGRESTSILSCNYLVAPGIYTVTLKWAETDPNISKSGQRIFGVYINQVFVKMVDPIGDARMSLTALDYSFTVSAAQGQITIVILRGSGNPFLNAVDIELYSPPPTLAQWVVSTDYIWAQNGGSLLVNTVPALVNLSPCPLGIDGNSTNFNLWINDLATPNNSEPVTSTGLGTCVSGAASGTVSFTPAKDHTSWMIGSASSGIQEGILSAGAGGHVQVPNGDITIRASIIIPFGTTVVCPGRRCNLKSAALSAQTLTIFSATGSLTGPQRAVTVNANANWLTTTSSTLTFSTTSGWGTGDLLFLQDSFDATTWGPATSTFFYNQISKVSSATATVVTFEQPVAIPMVTTHTNYAQEITPIKDITIEGFVLDGSLNNALATGTGIYLDKCENVSLRHLIAKNFNQSGFYIHESYNVVEEDLEERATGSVSYAGIWNQYSSNIQASNLRSIDTGGFGIQFDAGVYVDATNLAVTNSTYRALKLGTMGRSNFTNIRIAKTGTTGLSVANGSWANSFHNIHIMNTAQDSIWQNGWSNSLNIYDDVFISGSGGYGVHIFTTDDHVSLTNYAGTGTILLNTDANGPPLNFICGAIGLAVVAQLNLCP